MAEIASIRAGSSAPQGEQWFGGINPFVRVQHVERDGDVVRRWDLITDDAVREHSLRPFPKGTIVFPKSGASIRLEKRAMLATDAYLVSHLAAVNSATSAVDQEFLYFALRTVRFAREKADGYPTLNLTEIGNTLIAVPPVREQRAIAGGLRAVQEAREAAERVVSATRQLKRSLVQHLFTYGPVPFDQADRAELHETEVGAIPVTWSARSLGTCIRLAQYGLSIRGGASGRHPILRMNNLQDGQVATEDVHGGIQYVDLDEDQLGKFRLERGDILFNRTNSPELVGKTSLFDLDGLFVFASYLIRLCVNARQADPRFICYYLNLPCTQAKLKELASRGVSQSNINATKLKTFPVPVPPLAVQQEVVRRVVAVDAKLAAEQARVAALDNLFKSLLHHLMTARVRVPLPVAVSAAGEAS